MIYLTGSTNARDEPTFIARGVGLIVQPGNSYGSRVDRYPCWAADNGCFAARWDEDTWLEWLDRLPRDRCLFAVAPDVYPDAAATLERSLTYSDLVRRMGYPVALVAQDGAEHLDIPWDEFDALFIGGKVARRGEREWKTGSGAEALCRQARLLGKWVHMGRVNSLRRIQHARAMGCNSADGTFVKYRRRRRQRDSSEDDRDARGAGELTDWLAFLDRQGILERFEAPALPVHRDAILP